MKEKIEAKIKELEGHLKNLKNDLAEIERMLISNKNGQQVVIVKINVATASIKVLKDLIEEKKDAK